MKTIKVAICSAVNGSLICRGVVTVTLANGVELAEGTVSGMSVNDPGVPTLESSDNALV